jgi:hypothetical protein
MVVAQPCVLCEDELERWHVYRDDERGEESIEVEPLTHACEALRRLIAERPLTPAQRLKAQ